MCLGPSVAQCERIQTLHPPGPQDPEAPSGRRAPFQPACPLPVGRACQVLPCRTPLTHSPSHPAFRRTGSKKKHSQETEGRPSGLPAEEKRRSMAGEEAGEQWDQELSSLEMLNLPPRTQKSLPSVTSKWVAQLALPAEVLVAIG